MQGNIFLEMSDFLGQLNQQVGQQIVGIKQAHQKEVEELKKKIDELETKLAFNVREPDKKPDLKEIK